MLVFGILFLVLPGNGGPSQKGLLFLGYMVVAGFYLVQAFRQYWAKRQAGR
jgi:hypothetical protein